MPKVSELTHALNYVEAEIKKLEGVREALLATRAAVHKLQKPKAPKPPKLEVAR